MTAALWTSKAAADATGGALVGLPWEVSGISIDTRTLCPGDLFVAIEGLERDGHEFIAQAEAAGAAACLVSNSDNVKGPCLVVPDTLKGLEALGSAARERTKAKIGAVTGSVGKTGTKEALRTALAASGKTHVSEASYNNLWGVPLSLARMPVDTEYAIFEIGMNHPGEIIPLVDLVRPDVAIITTVAPVHLEFFKDETEIAEAKAEIFTGLKKGGTAIINRDIVHFDLLKTRAEKAGAGIVIGFGEHSEANAKLGTVKLHDTCTCVSANINGTNAAYGIGAAGKHWALNSLAVLSCVQALGADLAKAALAMRDVASPAGRGERSTLALATGGQITLVDESYNANPASMKAALETLGASEPLSGGRRIAVIGDMRELGVESEVLHGNLADVLRTSNPDIVFCCGPHMKALWSKVNSVYPGAWKETSSQLVDLLVQEVEENDIIMIKGSLGTNMAPLVSALFALQPQQTAEEA
jgi:UDP-N-acetylmuramoyl-tripeptide--D-alanyl-D-alanine ligase